MTQDHPQSPEPEKAADSSLLQALRNPVVDKLFAVIACLPYLFLLMAYIHSDQLDLVHIVMLIQVLMQVVTMFARRLNGTFLVERKSGARCTLRFPDQ